MPSDDAIERFVSLVEAGDYVPAIERFYSADSTKQENQARPRAGGRQAHIAREQAFLAKVKSVTAHCVRPILRSDDTVVIRWRFSYEWPDGTRSSLDEIAYQRWESDCIVSETFFYDPAQQHHQSLSMSY